MGSIEENQVAEIKKRLSYVVTTDEISDSEKVAILKKALEIIEKSEIEGEVL